MEQLKRDMKHASLLVLMFTALALIEVVAALSLNAIDITLLPAGTPESTVVIMKIVIAVVSLLVLLPEAYVGVRGLQLAKNPAPTKGHIVWAIILIVLSAISFFSPAIAAIQQVNVLDNVLAAVSILLETAALALYIKAANDLLRATK